MRYVIRDASNTAGSFYWNLGGQGIGIDEVPLDYVLYDPAFRGDDNKPFPITWLSPSFKSVWDNLQQFRQFNIDRSGVGSLDGPPVDPSRTFEVDEKALAAYAQLNFDFDLGVAIDGAIGLRAVRTTQRIQGTYLGAALDHTNRYTDWLPNLNMRIHLTRELQLRLAATQTRTRPSFTQLRPGVTLDPPRNCGGITCRPGTRGDPFLQQQDSNNYDASLEYYFSRTGFAAATVFRRDMKGFIVNRTETLPDLEPGTGLPLLITGPVNLSEGRIQGFEAQFSTFFDYDWVPSPLRAFGIQANVTHLDAKALYEIFPETFPNGAPNPSHAEVTLRLPDVSKWTYNLVGMYEKGGLTLRLAYNHRSNFPEAALAERDFFFTLQGRGNAVSRLDWSSSYAFNENLTFFFDWTNILGDPFQSDIVRVNYGAGGVASTPEIFPMLVRFEESVFSAGVRFRF